MTIKETIQTASAEFLAEGRHYAGLRAEQARLAVAEKAALATSVVLRALCLILLLAMGVLFLCLALGAWIASLTGSVALGYVAVAAVVAVLAVIVYALRQRLIEEPVTRAMTNIFAPEKTDE